MSSDRAFRIPRAHKDRCYPKQLVAIAATCASIGVALSGIFEATPRDEAERASAWQNAAAVHGLQTMHTLQAAQRVIEAAAARDSLEARARETETSLSASADPELAGGAQEHAHARPVHERRTARHGKEAAKPARLHGSLTYHCDAATQRASESGDCPHDRVLERRVWRVLARLSTCGASADALGRVDLRLWFGPGTATQAVFAAPAISPSLNLRAVSRCVAPDLSKLRATRKADRFELSLSLELTARD